MFIYPPHSRGRRKTTGGSLPPTKMKSIIEASVFVRRKYSRNAASSRSLVNITHLHCSWVKSSCQAIGFESSSRATHSSAVKDEDEAFSELGPEVSKCSAKQIKLVTEKPDHYMKPDNWRRERELAGRPFSADVRLRIKDITATIGNSSPTVNLKLSGLNDVSTSTDDSEKISTIESLARVSVQNIPSDVVLSELVNAISVFGKISSASYVAASDGHRSCNIEFEDSGSSRKAILAGKIVVGGNECLVHPCDVVDVVVIRIKNINKETTDYAIHSRCKSVGGFLGLARKSKDAVDTYFNVQNGTTPQNILRKLNATEIDLHRWSAEVLKTEAKHSEAPSEDEARYTLGMQIFYCLLELNSQVGMKKVYVEDLMSLHASIMHIESLPPNNSSDSK